ncbi:hypothetical protein [Agrobacterium rubi]|uniref:Uncharacterized protein n=2 Tax=Agrobacterium rubi TaxID=28099 RepID=A0AAE7R9K4_9HYPH|nr:hypothetical protein [Agrobacterium rubi]MBP1881018.1 hypothetical protein [Agrobacterium rubi]MCL6653741.1 hypothetical protein [Agrobacterium rubi]NTE88360.1 hypothetical protein [Agrobacterium rubi]NTF04126.1 hypothetical protein [Agrobacterium rubi]NTF38457.1 hypothetical protein [Agrobacterium rubi]
MKIFTAALCLISVGVLSGCVDDRGYRSGGYYSAGGYDRRYDNGRDYRNDRDFRRDRRGNWRDNDRDRYRNNDNRIIYGVIQR